MKGQATTSVEAIRADRTTHRVHCERCEHRTTRNAVALHESWPHSTLHRLSYNGPNSPGRHSEKAAGVTGRAPLPAMSTATTLSPCVARQPRRCRPTIGGAEAGGGAPRNELRFLSIIGSSCRVLDLISTALYQLQRLARAYSLVFCPEGPVLPSLGSADCITATTAPVTPFGAALIALHSGASLGVRSSVRPSVGTSRRHRG
jgi:hypothetical protein